MSYVAPLLHYKATNIIGFIFDFNEIPFIRHNYFRLVLGGIKFKNKLL